MELILNSVSTDISYKVSFKEAQLSIIKDRPPLPLVELLLKNFGLRLNDIKFNTDFREFFLGFQINQFINCLRKNKPDI